MAAYIKNPLDDGHYADPEARYYGGKYYIYVTHSLPFEEQHNQTCFISEDLEHWEKRENIIDLSGFPWVKAAVWAPTIVDVEKNGKYYYIFASNNVPYQSEIGGLEIAVADDPAGPFKGYLGRPLVNDNIHGAQPIDAHLFKDDDGTVYLLYGGWGHCNLAVMNEEMTGFVPLADGEIFREITPPGYVEGPCMFKRNGKYYLMWSSGAWTDGTYHVNYATAEHPWGPFDRGQKILWNDGCTFANGPGHNGYLYLPEKDLYLMVYHRHKTGETSPHARYLCMEKMELDKEGNILPVKMTEEWTL